MDLPGEHPEVLVTESDVALAPAAHPRGPARGQRHRLRLAGACPRRARSPTNCSPTCSNATASARGGADHRPPGRSFLAELDTTGPRGGRSCRAGRRTAWPWSCGNGCRRRFWWPMGLRDRGERHRRWRHPRGAERGSSRRGGDAGTHAPIPTTRPPPRRPRRATRDRARCRARCDLRYPDGPVLSCPTGVAMAWAPRWRARPRRRCA